MKNLTIIVRSYLLILSVFLTLNSYSQDFNVQHLQDDVARTGGSNTSFTPVSSTNNTVALSNNNRKSNAGQNGSSANLAGDDLAGARVLTGTGTLTYYRESASLNTNMRFNTSLWEYIGPSAGNNEMIVRGRYAVNLNGTLNSTTQLLTGIANATNCIPFITGIMNNTTSQDADSGTAIAYLENATTLRVLKGSNANNVTVYITVVEYTGSNWTVLHGDSGSVSADTGSLTLRNNSNGTGTATNVSAWNDAIIFSHHIGDTNASGVNDAIADNWPIMDPGSNNQTVDWSFNANHDSAGTNRQFVHVLTNSNLNVTRYSDNSNTAGESTIDITSAGLTNINEALIVGSSNSSGGGSAYARGWRNYYLNSTTQAAHWSHRDRNTMAHEIQIIDLAGLTSIVGPEINLVGNGNNINNNDTVPSTTDDTDFGSLDITGATNANIFTIQNTGTADLILNGGSAPFVTISGTHAADFTIITTATSPISASGSTTFEIEFDPSAVGLREATITINNNDATGGENPYSFSIRGTGTTPSYCTSNGNNSDSYNTVTRLVSFNTINNATPDEDNDYSDFTGISTTVNQGTPYNLTVNANTAGGYTTYTYVWIDWNQDSDFNDLGETYNLGTAFNNVNVATTLSPLSITIPLTATLGNTRMRVSTKYGAIPTNCETGFDGEVEDYTINVNSGTPQPEMNVVGNGQNINDEDLVPEVADFTDFGSTGAGSPISHTFTIQNTGTLPLTIGSLTFSGANPLDFSITTPPAASVAAGGSTTFTVDFDPTANGTRSTIISIINNDSDENPYNFTLQGIGVVPLTQGPGGVTADLELWLKDTDGLGYTDGQSVSLWADQGRGADATVNTAGQEPTYYDNAAKNINFNPVVEFDNTFSTFSLDTDYSYDDTSTQFLEGTSGMYTQDIFVVIIPDETPVNNSFGFMDVFCGDADFSTDATDATGIGFGDFTGRVDDESICFAIDTYDTGVAGDGYAVNDGPSTTYRNVGIINARNNSAVTQQELYYNANNIESNQNDIPSFVNVSDSRYWLGRSEGWEATTNARIAEVITFSSRKDDANLTQERNRIQSYLGIKYGITLGINGTSQDYVDSDGSIIWDNNTGVPANDIFNYDIAGIGRDDDSDLNQKQSQSVNNDSDAEGRTQGILTMGLTDIYDTNNLNQSSNPTTFNDKEFLVWGNNGVDLSLNSSTISVDMSAGIGSLTTNVTFTGIQRIWKVVENGGDIPMVKLSIPLDAIRNITPPGNYYMFISDTPIFDPTASYRLMTQNGANLETDYDFDGTKYITFGYAPQVVVERSIYFDGVVDYIDVENKLNLNPTEFTISAWINRDSRNVSILSKRDASYTEGYDLKILNNRRLEMSWGASGTNSITSSIIIPENEWHQVAVIYDGTTAKMYIDGVLDTTETLPVPTATNQSFYIAAAGKNTPTAHYRGNIDEVRIWDTALTQTQLQYIMNQEIENNGAFVDGKIMPTTVTKNDIISIPWSQLAGYYPMSIYTYTNTEDESGNGNQGYLRNLNTVDFQTAPLPYKSSANGDWNTNSTWLNGNVQTIPGTASIVDNTKTVNWNIVETNHDVTMVNSTLPSGNFDNRSVLGLFVNSNKLIVDGDNTTATGNGLTVSHYLSLDGKIDLEGESQLIQSTDSDLDVTSAGTIEKDQQGTQDYFTYNYWSSPVGVSNTTSNNNSYTLNDNIFKDGSNSVAPVNMNFVSGYNGNNGTPISIANYWIWKFNNRTSQDYASWQHVRNTGTMFPGEGFTMKGIADTSGNVILEQNYTIEGKPNNGDITLPINAGNDYLIGNPYASALNSDTFILANTNTTGAIYYWEHFGGGTHNTIEYQGGYAVYNLSGGVPAIQYDFVTGGNDLSGGTGLKTPGRYIPVAQGFFVIGNTTGNINFSNNQRVFTKEGGSSVFVRNSQEATNRDSSSNSQEDNRLKIRLSFESANSYKRQLLVTRDDIATNLIDFGFDAVNKDEQTNDMFWMVENEKLIIQGTNTINESTTLPLGIITTENGINTFKIDELLNFPEDLQVYLHDKTLDIYHNLNDSKYQIDLSTGEYLERFELTFTNQALSIEEVEMNNVEVSFVNDLNSIVINNPKNIQIDQAKITNMLGQTVYTFDDITNSNYIELKTKNLSVGTYIINLKTEIGEISKKVLVN